MHLAVALAEVAERQGGGEDRDEHPLPSVVTARAPSQPSTKKKATTRVV